MINKAELLAMQVLEVLLLEPKGYTVTRERQLEGRFTFTIAKRGEPAIFSGIAQRERDGDLSIRSLTVEWQQQDSAPTETPR